MLDPFGSSIEALKEKTRSDHVLIEYKHKFICLGEGIIFFMKISINISQWSSRDMFSPPLNIDLPIMARAPSIILKTTPYFMHILWISGNDFPPLINYILWI